MCVSELTSQSIQRTRGMQMRRQTSSDVNKLPDSFDPCCLVEVASSDRFSKDIEICPCGYDIHLLKFHDVLQLSPYFTCFSEQLGMQKVSHGPVVTESAKMRQLIIQVCVSCILTHGSSTD